MLKEEIKMSDLTKTADAGRSETGLKTREVVYIGFFAALTAICSWISIPMTVPFTLQTFAVFLSVIILGGKRGTISVVVYILLGAIGLPVFSGFKGGLGVLLGSTGGYIIGFIASALIMWAFETFLGKKLWMYAVSMAVALAACYAFGTVWFMIVYNNGNDTPASLAMILGWCVIPFIIPDVVKIIAALIIGQNKQIRKLVNND